ncbi:MAG: hypothetical protein NVS4B7_10010 [Ktedonobacteraceae bacterium]
MPLWDSVQRSLEKATQEATRIAKTQRLRSTIDGLSRQLSAQHTTIFNKTMDLFVTGQLTQSELLPLCQEMINLQQQLNQAQNELKQLPASQAQNTGSQTQSGAPHPYSPPGSSMYSPTGEELAPTLYAPPPPEYQTYLDSTQAIVAADVPPPSPGIGPQTVSAIKIVEEATSASEFRLCPVCRAELPPDNAFCHNCGSAVQVSDSSHLPTMQAGYMLKSTPADTSTQETMRAEAPINRSEAQQSINASVDYPLTTRGEQPAYLTAHTETSSRSASTQTGSSFSTDTARPSINEASNGEAAQNEEV